MTHSQSTLPYHARSDGNGKQQWDRIISIRTATDRGCEMSAASLRPSSRRLFQHQRRRNPLPRHRRISKPGTTHRQIRHRCPHQLSSRLCQLLTRVPELKSQARVLQGRLVMSQQRLPPRPMQLLRHQSQHPRCLPQSAQTLMRQQQPGSAIWQGNGRELATLLQSPDCKTFTVRNFVDDPKPATLFACAANLMAVAGPCTQINGCVQQASVTCHW